MKLNKKMFILGNLSLFYVFKKKNININNSNTSNKIK